MRGSLARLESSNRLRGRRAMRTAALALALSVAAPAGLALAQEQEETVEEVVDGHAHEPFYLTPQFGAALINFVLLLLVLRRLGARPLATYLGDRRRVMERSMAEAAEMRAKAEALHREYSARLAQLDSELAKLREDIARAAEEDKRRIVEDAEETARRLRLETEALIDQHAKALSAGVRLEVVEAAAAAAEQLLRSALTDADQQRLAESYRQRLAGNGVESPHKEAPRKSDAAAEERA